MLNVVDEYNWVNTHLFMATRVMSKIECGGDDAVWLLERLVKNLEEHASKLELDLRAA